MNQVRKYANFLEIAQRKDLLDDLKVVLKVKDNMTQQILLHHLLFPISTLDDDMDYEQHNLWVISERLTHHYYSGSDKLYNIKNKQNNNLLFNCAFALNDRPNCKPIETVSIIKFKGPNDFNFDNENNPVDPILSYIETIQSGKAKSNTGRPIHVSSETKFFGYAICEVTPQLKQLLSRRIMKVTPDGRGFFGYFDQHRAYIEVMSYEKIIHDAFKRNQILFDKLQLKTPFSKTYGEADEYVL